MKKKKNIIIILILCICLIGLGINSIKADSGWDTSYDSGSSLDSGSSSWDSSGGYSSFSGAGTKDLIIFIIIFVIPCIIFIISLFRKLETSASTSVNISVFDRQALTDDQIYAFDSSLNPEKFKMMVYECFVNVQNAWMNFDYEVLRKNLSDELYNQYEMQLETLKAKGQKNVMSDFELIDLKIIEMEVVKNIEKIDVQLKISFRDYVVDNKDKVVRGKKNNIYNMNYILTFTRTIDSINDKCPKCGAPIEDKSSNICPYCRATININNNEFVLSKKTLISQNTR